MYIDKLKGVLVYLKKSRGVGEKNIVKKNVRSVSYKS